MSNLLYYYVSFYDSFFFSSINPSPQRLQTALGLYSNDLCGLVLLNDNNDLSGFSGLAKGIIFESHLNSCETMILKFFLFSSEFYEVCDSSTEFHFPNVSEQLETLKVQIKDAIAWRNSCQHPGNLTTSEQQVVRILFY